MQHFALAFAGAEDAGSAIASKQGSEAGTRALRRSLVANPRVVRLLRKSMDDALTRAGIPCTDCAPPPVTPRSVAFADLVPYLVRLCYVSADDIPPKAGGHVGFHVCNCTNDLKRLGKLDADLSEVSLAALYSLLEDEASYAAFGKLVGPHAKAACGPLRGKVTRAQLDAVNDELQATLAGDAAYLARVRPAVAREAAFADLACSDCAGP